MSSPSSPVPSSDRLAGQSSGQPTGQPSAPESGSAAAPAPEPKTWNQHVADVLGLVFVLFVLLFAMQGVILDFVKWITPLITPDW